MKNTIKISLLLLVVAVISCRKGEDAFTRPLDQAIKERKISKQKALQIRQEYAKLPDTLQNKYVKAVTAILEAGGDSTHVDVVRRRLIRKK
jgi:hypothetical protein